MWPPDEELEELKPQACEFADDYDDEDDDLELEKVPRSGRRQLMPIERLR